MDNLLSNATLESKNDSSNWVSEQPLLKKGKFRKVFDDTFAYKETTGSLTSSERVKQEMVMYFKYLLWILMKIH